jgi:cyclophilin family peptidyl-prolyl cis-trans isomerase
LYIFVSFAAGSGPNSRNSQLFIAYTQSPGFGREKWETPVGRVIQGFDEVIMKLNHEYGDMPPWGKGPVQGKIWNGPEYIKNEFPHMDHFTSCRVHRFVNSDITSNSSANKSHDESLHSHGSSTPDLQRELTETDSSHGKHQHHHNANIEEGSDNNSSDGKDSLEAKGSSNDGSRTTKSKMEIVMKSIQQQQQQHPQFHHDRGGIRGYIKSNVTPLELKTHKYDDHHNHQHHDKNGIVSHLLHAEQKFLNHTHLSTYHNTDDTGMMDHVIFVTLLVLVLLFLICIIRVTLLQHRKVPGKKS